MFAKLVCVLIFAILFVCCHGGLPPSIIPCNRNNPDLDNCITNAVDNLRPLLATGDLGGGYHLPPLEPLYLDNIDISRGQQFQVILSDLTVNGGSNFNINKLTANASNLAFDLLITLPRLDFTGKYNMQLKILLLDIKGNGNVKGYTENAKAVAKIRGVRVPKDDGLEYVRFTKLALKIKIDILKLQLDNLFNGDRLLGEIGNAVINDNQELFLNEIIPGLEKVLSKKFLDIANKLLSNTTYDEMYPL